MTKLLLVNKRAPSPGIIAQHLVGCRYVLKGILSKMVSTRGCRAPRKESMIGPREKPEADVMPEQSAKAKGLHVVR